MHYAVLIIAIAVLVIGFLLYENRKKTMEQKPTNVIVANVPRYWWSDPNWWYGGGTRWLPSPQGHSRPPHRPNPPRHHSPPPPLPPHH